VKNDSRDQKEVENRQVGTHVWDEYPTYEEWIAQFDMDSPVPDMAALEPAHEGHLPVWCGGNIYFNGARAYRAEEDGRVDTEHCVSADVEETADGWVFRTDLYQWLGGMKCRMIHSDLLGKAFEPEERYENPDGTAITFDTDYFGKHRGTDVIPGPFAQESDCILVSALK
jgi:hypothetical protein